METLKVLGELFSLKNKVAIVTGAGRGIGRTIALAYAHAGACMVVVDIDFEGAHRTAEELENSGGKAIAIKADVANPEEVQEIVDTTLDRFGGLDILVNNAGVTKMAPCEEYSLSDWERVIDVDLKGVFLCSQRAGRVMIKNRKGKIINIASIAGQVGTVDNAIAYKSAKGGVINFTRGLAVEWGKYNINVNAIGPGMVVTEFTTARLSNDEYRNYWLRETPLGRFLKMEDLRGVAIFLASPASDMITGQTIFVDGGWLAK